MTKPQQDDFDGFDSSAGVMAFIYSEDGAEGLRALLALSACDQESLLRDVQELTEVGLPDVAAIVAEVAANTPPKQNPHPEDTADGRDWDRRHKQDFTGFYLDDGRG
jgi:hypothetical protein